MKQLQIPKVVSITISTTFASAYEATEGKSLMNLVSFRGGSFKSNIKIPTFLLLLLRNILVFFLQPTNVRAAHNYGDLDPFKFRWLIPLSALQVRLGNTAGNSLSLNSVGLKAFLGFSNTASSLCPSGASGNRQV